MRHVALYVHDFRSSGVVRNALAYAARLAADHRVTLVAGHGGGLFGAAAATGAYDTVALSASPGWWPRAAAALRLRRWSRAAAVELLFSVGNTGHPTCYWASRGAAWRRVYRISTAIARDDGARGRVRRVWMAMLVRDAARIALVGDANLDARPFRAALADGRAVAIANGVDRIAALAAAAAPPSHRWLEEPVPVVLAIGRLRPQKNFDVLIAAVARARRTTALRLVILGAGTDEERRRLAALAQAAGIGDAVLLAGETGNVFAWLARARVFALPSLWEGSSMALVEALAVGVPVVAAVQAGDAAAVLDHGRYGLLVDARDPDALARALLRQASDRAVRPGDRADAYGPSADAYARLIAGVAGEDRTRLCGGDIIS